MTSNRQPRDRTADKGRHSCDKQSRWAQSVRKGSKLGAAVLCLGLIAAGCQASRVPPATTEISISKDIVLHPIAQGVWIHTTFFDLPGLGRVPANGLVVITGRKAMLIDLPWTDALTAALCDWIAHNHGATVNIVIPTHFHEDCMGGLAEAHRRGAVSYALDRSVEIAGQKGTPVPKVPYHDTITIRCGSITVVLAYFGAGHTADNVVAWLPRQKVLFAGCLVKSLDSNSLGNTKDGDLTAYPITLRKVQAAFPEARIVIPGHGDWGGPELIEHTLRLCEKKDANPGGR